MDLKGDSMSSPAFRFRLATLDDAPALLSIYVPYVEKTAISFEYDVPSLDEFRRRIADISRKYPYLVAEDENGQLLGYAYTHTFIARKAYDHCAESTIYLALDARKHGLGKRFYRAIEELSLAQNIYNLYACIGEPQGADDEYLTDNSIRFHEHMGFRRIGVSGYPPKGAAAASLAAGTTCPGRKNCSWSIPSIPNRSSPSRSSTRRLSPTSFAAPRNKEPKFYKKSCTPY